MDVLLVVDMQEASISSGEQHDVEGVVRRIDALAERVRRAGGCVVFVLHDGGPEDGLEPFTPGWEPVRGLTRQPGDRTVRKTLNDAFRGTDLGLLLAGLGATRVVVCGWATDFCVDATVWGALGRGFEVVVAGDCHTLADRPSLSAAQLIEHHNWRWTELISDPPVRVVPAAEVP